MSKYVPDQIIKRYAVYRKYECGNEQVFEYFETVEKAALWIQKQKSQGYSKGNKYENWRWEIGIFQ